MGRGTPCASPNEDLLSLPTRKPITPILVPILYETKCSYKVQTTFLHEHRPSCLLRTSCLRPQTLDKNKLLVAFCTPEFHLSTGSEPTDRAAISTCSIIGEEVPEHSNPVLTGRQGERSYCSTPLILACLILLHALPAVSTAVMGEKGRTASAIPGQLAWWTLLSRRSSHLSRRCPRSSISPRAHDDWLLCLLDQCPVWEQGEMPRENAEPCGQIASPETDICPSTMGCAKLDG